MHPRRGRVVAQPAHRRRQPVKGRDKFRQGALAQGGQPHAARVPVEQRRTQILLQRLDLGGHRAGADLKLLCRLRESSQPRCGFKGAQRVQGRQAAGHDCIITLNFLIIPDLLRNIENIPH